MVRPCFHYLLSLYQFHLKKLSSLYQKSFILTWFSWFISITELLRTIEPMRLRSDGMTLERGRYN